ncbi:GIY-YIG nuclease family protein [Sulfidibacter corallicola]|uniref:GIY-YIG nuclease family protein n=1 Tax=Sulfidibacter corallicola TaxID=2818388 RepID=A0A8A4TQ88_SULCO|nr:GIY-YIG nuclease family protein [Sulfidibacter corallicola]QTD52146.1 GIY-YIG nuclease family protein [Sulfidibacter corallicola]
MLQCADGTYYIGCTNDLEARIRTHNAGKGAKYTMGRRPVAVVYREAAPSRGDALRRERELKRLSRLQKVRLHRRAEMNARD